jgi:hypothetical protein
VKLTKFAVPIALVAGVIAFAITFVLLSSAYWSPLLAALISLGILSLVSFAVWRLLDNRTDREAEQDAYTWEADRKVREVLAKVEQIRRYTRQISEYNVAETLEQMCEDVEQLVRRIKQRNPSGLLSQATTLDGYLVRMVPLVEKYIDITDYQRYYGSPQKKLQEIKEGFQSFDEYVVKSITLLEEGQQLILNVDLKMIEAAKYTRLT